jgi:hypothetical protein
LFLLSGFQPLYIPLRRAGKFVLARSPNSRFWSLGNNQLIPQIIAEDYLPLAHNQSNQKASPLPILDNGPLTVEKRI